MARMLKAVVFGVALFLAVIVAAGCETTKNVVLGIADGVPKDIKQTSDNTWNALSKADTWVRERLW